MREFLRLTMIGAIGMTALLCFMVLLHTTPSWATVLIYGIVGIGCLISIILIDHRDATR